MVLFWICWVEVIREIGLSLNDHDDNIDRIGDGEDSQIDDDDGEDDDNNEYDDNKNEIGEYDDER